MSEKLRCFEITPGMDKSTDSMVVVDTEKWRDLLDIVETILDCQWSDGKPWEEIGVSINGVEMTREELAELEDE